MKDKEEIQINIPGQILDYVDTQENLLKLFKYIKGLQRLINLFKTSCDESQEIICDYAKENKKLKEELELEKSICSNQAQRIKETVDYIENDMPYLEEPDEEIERCDGTTYMTMKEYDTSILLNKLKGQ